MAKPKKRPHYDPDKIMKSLLDAVSESYEETGELKQTAAEFDMSPLKIRKLLITSGAYSNEISKVVNDLRVGGKSIAEIQALTGLKKSSVNGYLPYTKSIYKAEELSMNAERINVYRRRQQAVRNLMERMNEYALWNAVVAFQRYPFRTMTGLPFTYELKKDRDGDYNRELIIDRKGESETMDWGSVVKAFEKAVELQGEPISRPKVLGDIRGVSYIYPMLYRFGVIEVAEEDAWKMEVKRPLRKNH
ncbi:hypothetical protein [Oribacterium sp. WCC10]|uniref:hypothetical protein n=1 Tax=Oribacterium sp. WCC10 TaxID=1855343 RepID=UPI0008ECC277|nr:hypothetical protein [Oribacterium sp. WCC10]SFG27367.1 hypothetical protein SAMN05216356_104195 [Oribacterium sp. WCC10]